MRGLSRHRLQRGEARAERDEKARTESATRRSEAVEDEPRLCEEQRRATARNGRGAPGALWHTRRARGKGQRRSARDGGARGGARGAVAVARRRGAWRSPLGAARVSEPAVRTKKDPETQHRTPPGLRPSPPTSAGPVQTERRARSRARAALARQFAHAALLRRCRAARPRPAARAPRWAQAAAPARGARVRHPRCQRPPRARQPRQRARPRRRRARPRQSPPRSPRAAPSSRAAPRSWPRAQPADAIRSAAPRRGVSRERKSSPTAAGSRAVQGGWESDAHG